MDVELLGHPFSRERRLGPWLAEALADADAFWAVTAWAQVSGLQQLAEPLRALRERGGSASAIVGIDGGIATHEALTLAAELFEPAWVFHDTGQRTFHPKLFCVERAGLCFVSVGSSNLTSGGLFANYEANVLFTLNPRRRVDAVLLDQIFAYLDALTADGMPCERLTPALLERLGEDETLVASQTAREESATTAHAKARAIAGELFGDPVGGLPGAPAAVGAGRRARREEAPRSVPGRRAIPPGARPELRWTKRLTASDTLRKPDTSHQRNYVALSQARHDIDQTTWFRHEFFDGVAWSEQTMRTGRVKEVARIPFEVVVGDDRVGVRELTVDHAEGRIARQNNSPTYLNWSDILPMIREHDFSGWWLELARFPGGRFRLSLLPERPAG